MALLKLGMNRRLNALFMAHACNASYAAKPGGSESYRLLDLGSPQIFPASKSKLGDSAFVAVANQARNEEAKKDIVIVIRGSNDAQDWVGNVRFRLVKVEGGRVHEGFQQGAESLWPEFIEILEEHVGKGDRVHLTGHSRGGAIAVLLAQRLHREYSVWRPEFVPKSVFTFGAPRVGDIDFHRSYLLPEKTHMFVNRDDVVPLMPPMSTDFVHVTDQVMIRDGELIDVDVDSPLETISVILSVFVRALPKLRSREEISAALSGHNIEIGYVEPLS